jgi:hypothetical protein
MFIIRPKKKHQLMRRSINRPDNTILSKTGKSYAHFGSKN